MTISIKDLTLEQIEELLPQLQKQLEEAEKLPIDEIVSQKFKSEWELVSKVLEEQFEESLQKLNKSLYAHTALETVLNEKIGERNTKLFLEVAKNCIESNSFKETQLFYSKVTDPLIKAIARLSFSTLSHYFNHLSTTKFKHVLNECKKVNPEEINNIISIYTTLNLLSI